MVKKRSPISFLLARSGGLQWIGIFLGVVCMVLIVLFGELHKETATIKVGILHSLTGTLAISEQPVVNATLLAIEEINQNGGLLGQKIEPIVVDGKSSNLEFARGAQRLISEAGVVTVFGCWTSASRKTVKPIFEQYQHLLIYPLQYEGLEESPNIVYTGATPNQQIIPAVKWAFENLGQKFYLVGSDYVFPRAANTIIKSQLKALKAVVTGESYLPLGSKRVNKIVREISETKPDVILNTINGDTNIAFFRELRRAGITPQQIPTISFSIGETELQSLDIRQMVGDYAAWNYFQSVDSPVNQQFVQNYRQKYGLNQVVNDPMESAYFGVYLWAQAVQKAQSAKVQHIRSAIVRQSRLSPGGVVYIDSQNQHTWKTVRIGQIAGNGQFTIKWSSERPIPPTPYPIFRSKEAWQIYLNNLYQEWGYNWANVNKEP